MPEATDIIDVAVLPAPMMGDPPAGVDLREDTAADALSSPPGCGCWGQNPGAKVGPDNLAFEQKSRAGGPLARDDRPSE
jgi:hypothetical protein